MIWLWVPCVLVSGCLIDFPAPEREQDVQQLCAAGVSTCDPWAQVPGPSGGYNFSFASESGNQILKVQSRKDFYQGPGQNITTLLKQAGPGKFQASARVRVGSNDPGIQGLITIQMRKTGTAEWAKRSTPWTLLSPSWISVEGELDLSLPVQGINAFGELDEAWLSIETACNPSDPGGRCDGAKTVDLFVDDAKLIKK